LQLQSFDCSDQIAARIGLEQKSARAGPKHFSYDLIGIVHGENQDCDVRGDRQDLAGSLQSVQVRHANVEQNEIRFLSAGEFDGLTSVFCFSTNFPTRMTLKQCADATPCHLMIICNQDSKHSSPPDS
jgi:hypothetical protein